MESAPSQRRAYRVIAIDGPAASGKSSVARELSRRLGFVYVNSGGIYRAITWYVLQREIDPDDFRQIARALQSVSIICRLCQNESRTLVNSMDPAEHLRDDQVNRSVSRVSRFALVRQIVAQQLHELARENDLVVEGRDIGSVVFPDTPYKFYVDASPSVRLRRRAAQGERDEIMARDHADSSRAISPLVIAKDAEVIDTSHLSIEGVVAQIMARLKEMGLEAQT
ncbi:MAG: (d)CMP kinase [Chthoniobacterales bacterium]|nr:(d)CMP kinase [Chthoniobacterales bacterium]